MSPPDRSEFAAIHEALKTYYLGRASIKLPESLELNYLSVKIRLNESLRKTVVTFHETTGGLDANGRIAEPSEMLNNSTEIKSLMGEASPLGEEELGGLFDRPAKLVIHRTRSTILDDIRSDLELPPAPDKLEIDLALKEDWGLLEFNYEQELKPTDLPELDRLKTSAQNDLLNWLRSFLPCYLWTGRNEKPPAGALATAYGFLRCGQPLDGGKNQDDNQRLFFSGDFFGNFTFRGKRGHDSNLDFLTFTARSGPTALKAAPAGGRKVGGHPGEESRNFNWRSSNAQTTGKTQNSETLYLEWEDRSSHPPDNFHPLYDLALYAALPMDRPDERARYLALWETLLDSVQLIKED